MTLRKAFGRAAILAFLLFAALFIAKFAMEGSPRSSPAAGWSSGSASFDTGRKNYASQRQSGEALAPSDAQKYEKIATIGQSTSHFDADRAKVETLITAAAGLTQYEQQQGLDGHRTLYLGIGVPPAKFDAFIVDVRKIAKNTNLSVIKTDKTNEYRLLRARRETLDKSRKALLDMAASGGSLDERLKVQAQLTAVEDKIQDLGVSLGDFNAENEFCTVKLTLVESAAPRGLSVPMRAFQSFAWAVEYFLYVTVGFLFLALAVWLGVLALGLLVHTWKKIARD